MVDDARLRRLAVRCIVVAVGVALGYVWTDVPLDWRFCVVGAAIGLTLVVAWRNRRPA